ncbi:hypothetical protein H6F67_19825 [Microcoleus sp. FACHB-1515]|uniref:putative PEP-binding protein n=1 Tax=Cyanophyceae TaxID=3028117 RepID=UPI0016853D5E|nr:putative PEP-binding protein [Microcoleus sp. FACHB-1515]MBD2092101.1 hypothetical protein [Microcoleus sp. FACHB-1515]
MNHFLWLDQVQPSHHCIVGEQALSLSKLMQRGFPVAGGVITAIAFEQFRTAIDWLDPLLTDFSQSTLHLESDAKQLQAIARQLRDRIAATPLRADWLPHTWQTPALLLRPQVLHSGASANDWLAPQICWAEPDAIAVALKRVWSEVFRAKSLLFWQRMRSGSPSESHLPLAEIQLAVLVQPISAAIASGRLRLSETEKLLQGQPGLDGISGLTDTILANLLQGSSASPHHLQLNSHDRSPDCLVRTTATAQPILQPSQIQQLMQLAQAIAAEMHSGIEFEWLLTDRFWLTQVRSLSGEVGLPQPSLASDPVWVRGLAASSGQAIGTAWVLNDETIPADLPADAIVIAKRLAIASFHRFSIQGFAIEQGSMTSHSAILARELGIPAIVGAIDATRQIKTGDRVCLDGDRGLLYPVAIDRQLTGKSMTVKPSAPIRAIALSPPHLSPTQPKLMVNMSQAATLETIQSVPIAGIGLLRADLLLLDLLQAPATVSTSIQIKDRIRPFAAALHPRPVFYRSIDRSLQVSGRPLLGLHGTSSYALETSWFQRELLALRQLQQEGYDNLHLLLPFVRTVEEFEYCRSQVEQAGLMQPSFQLWIMAEVPSVLFLLPDYVKAGVQGIAIGSNDLTQLLLGIDRDEPQFAHHTAMHPAVLQAMQQLIQTAQRLNISCSICGQAASQPELIALLVQWGISAISVEPQAIETTAQAIAAHCASRMPIDRKFDFRDFH